MTRIEEQVEMLRRDGYIDAANLLEQSAMTINTDAEFKYLCAFVAETDFSGDSGLGKRQLRALWTAYCFHEDLEVDTRSYDCALRKLLDRMPQPAKRWQSFDHFDDFMCAYLV